MQPTAMRKRLKFLPLFIFIALAATAAGQSGAAAGIDSRPRAEGAPTAGPQPARAQGAVSFAVEQFAPTNVPSRVSRTMHGDPSLLLPELRAGRSAAPGGLLPAPQVDPRLKSLGW